MADEKIEKSGDYFQTPAGWLAKLSAFFDTLVDGLLDLVGEVPGFFGRLLRPIQNGLVQFYALAMVLGLTVFILALIRPW